MADALTKISTPSLATLTPPPTSRFGSGLIAGEYLGPFDACHINDADGKVYKSKEVAGASSSSSYTEGARVDGYAATETEKDQPVTLFHGVVANMYDKNTTPGLQLYLSADVSGGLTTTQPNSEAPQVGLTLPKGRAFLKMSW